MKNDENEPTKKSDRILRITSDQSELIRFLIMMRLDQLAQRPPSEHRDEEIALINQLEDRLNDYSLGWAVWRVGPGFEDVSEGGANVKVNDLQCQEHQCPAKASVLVWSQRDHRVYPMCSYCADHSVTNRGMSVVESANMGAVGGRFGGRVGQK